MNLLHFRLDCDPPKATAQQQKTSTRGGFVKKYDPPNVKKAKQSLLAMLKPHAPSDPFTGPCVLEVKWIYPIRKSETAKRKRYAAEVGALPCHTRPDCDNLLKGFQDQLTKAGFFTDDSIVYDVRLSKWWGVRPGIVVTIKTENLI